MDRTTNRKIDRIDRKIHGSKGSCDRRIAGQKTLFIQLSINYLNK
jgi:hypothetical protein